MICPKCGKENAEDATVCVECGAPLVEKPAEAAPAAAAPQAAPAKKPLPLKTIAIAACAVVLVVAAIVLIVSLGGSGGSKGYAIPKDSITFVTNPDKEEVMILKNGADTKERVEGSVSSTSTSPDGSTAATISKEGELILFNGKKMTIAIENPKASLFCNDGTALLVVGGKNYEDLYLVDAKTGKATKMEGDDELDNAVISPDGKTVVFSRKEKNDDGSTTVVCYLYKGGKTEKLGKKWRPIAVTNNAKTIYARNSEKDGIYKLDTKGEGEKIADNVDDMIFSFDYSQLMFISKEHLYYSLNGGEKQDICKVDSTYFDIVLPARAQAAAKLNGNFYEIGDKIVYINNKWQAETVTSTYSGTVRVSADGSYVFYIKNEKLMRTAASKPTENETIVKDVDTYRITSKGDAVYYLDEEETLYYLKIGKDAKKIADDVDSIYMTADDYALFIADRSNGAGTLLQTKDGSAKKKIADDVTEVRVYESCIYYRNNYDKSTGTSDLYAATSGVKFKKIASEVK